ncbi:chloride channel protein [Nocardia cyriacigeorgica]|uniref:chloride channel protein n=1 Tax=Nocardia cyriacigeorgica TaxID=135487 RepID=UPI0013B94DF7|nr:chloride channel protein [Nocardia cyriacigeorgica]NEW48794.1 chloride channel protein [Nocardia cyriacigeorgica]
MTADGRRVGRWGAVGAALLLAGVAAGLGAATLRFVLDAATHMLLGSVVELIAVTDGQWRTPVGPLREHVLLVPLLVAAGMMGATLLSRWGGRQVNGTDGVIAAVNTRDLTGLTVRGAAVKLGGTAVTLGSGGSGGTEGPVAQIAASLGAMLTRRLRLADAEAALVVTAALGAGVGALFQAPIGGALLAAELLRRRGIDWQALLFALPVAPIAFGVFIALYGYEPMFGVKDLGAWWDPTGTAVLVGVGVVCAVTTRLYVVSFHRVGRLLAPARRRPFVTAAVAGAGVGIVGIFVPMALSTGYGTVSLQLTSTGIAMLPLWMVLALPLVKIATTVVTLHAGGVGGVFGPAMVIGASSGALCWRLATDAGLAPGPAAACTLAGLAACLGPAVRAPLAAIVFTAEVAGYHLPPLGLVLAVIIAAACTRDITLFPSQKPNQLSRRYQQLDVSDMLKSVVMNKAPSTRRTDDAIRSGGPNQPGSAVGDDPMESDDTRGLPDLTDTPLEDLLGDRRPDVTHAFHTARRRRAAVGIIFAGHNAGGGA